MSETTKTPLGADENPSARDDQGLNNPGAVRYYVDRLAALVEDVPRSEIDEEDWGDVQACSKALASFARVALRCPDPGSGPCSCPTMQWVYASGCCKPRGTIIDVPDCEWPIVCAHGRHLHPVVACADPAAWTFTREALDDCCVAVDLENGSAGDLVAYLETKIPRRKAGVDRANERAREIRELAVRTGGKENAVFDLKSFVWDDVLRAAGFAPGDADPDEEEP